MEVLRSLRCLQVERGSSGWKADHWVRLILYERTEGQERLHLHKTVMEHLGRRTPRRVVFRFVEGQAHGGSAEPMRR